MKWARLLSLLALVNFQVLITSLASVDEVPDGRAKGDGLKAVLKPIPPKEPAEALRALEVIDGFTVEFVAHEPLVLDPVAAAIEENGLLYVAEDADYPYRPEEGESPKGRIRLLKDSDNDGFYEESRLFADGLLWPAGIAPWKGGVFVTAPPDIWYFKDTDADGKADVKEKVYVGFGTSGSQYIMNNPQWGLDHRIYVAVAGNGGMVRRADRPGETAISVSRRDFQFDPATRDFESVSGGKQFGNTFDDWGNRLLCTQDTPVYQVVFPQRYLERNPLLSAPESVIRLVPSGAPIFRTSPIEAWRAIRSSRRLLAERGSPKDSGVSHHVLDGVAGSTVYRGGAFPAEFYGNLFCGDAQNNLVHRRSLTPDGVLFRSERLDPATEFLRSTDNWFRPVNFVNAPDGTLYVLDLAREVLEAVHIPMDVVSHLDLTSGRDRGRIYRVKPIGFQRTAPPKLREFTSEQLAACLESPHAWWRETAHRLLFERQDKSAESPLRRLLRQSSRTQARLHALWSMEGLGLLSDRDVQTALSDEVPAIRENAVQLAEPRLNLSGEILARCLELASDPDARVRFQLAFTLGASTDSRAVKALSAIAKKDAGDYFIRTAVLTSAHECAASLITDLLKDAPFVRSGSANPILEELSRFAGGRSRTNEVLAVLATALGSERKEIQQLVVVGLAEGLRFSGENLSSRIEALNAAESRRFHDLIADALRTVAAKEANADQIRKALRLLECAAPEKARASVLGLLDQFPTAPVQVAAVRTLARLNAPGWDEALLARRRMVSPEARREILRALVTREASADALLSEVERGRITAGELDAAAQASLRNHGDPSIRKRVKALWGGGVAGAENEAIEKYREALSLKGDAAPGQEIFQRLCSSCHRLNGVGNDVGPNLALSATRSPDELLTHILDPNRTVDPAYVDYTIATRDGEFHSGIIVADNSASVTLKGVNIETTILRPQIKSISSDGLSLMPVGLEQGLSPQDLANLLSFLIHSQYDHGTSGQSFSRDMPERTR